MNVAEFIQTRAEAGPGAVQPARRKRLRTLIIGGAVALAAGAALTLTWPYLRPGQSGAVVSMEEARVEAKRALAAFLNAPTPEQRADLVIGGQQVLPLMQAYYAGREIDALSVEGFEPASWSFSREMPDCVAFELHRGRALSTVVACLKRSASGRWLLDWDTWTQSLDHRFRDFIMRPAEGEHILRVRLTSSTVSEDVVKLAVTDPFNVGSTLNFDITRADLVALYMADLPAGKSRTATVQFVWLNNGLTGTLQPFLRRHICWGFQELDGVEAAEREPARARKHHQPAPREAPGKELASNAVNVIEAAVQTSLLPAASIPAPSVPAPVKESKTVRRANRR